MSNHSAFMAHLKKLEQRPTLKKLIEDNVYQAAKATLEQEKADKGFTQEWLAQRLSELNKEFLGIAQDALAECERHLNVLEAERQRVNSIYYQHNYSPTDYADLQFMQTLIKTRLLNEAHKQPALAERILTEYINTQKGARAIMFLANDGEVGTFVKPLYAVAARQAETASEKRFNADKAAELAKVNVQLVDYTQTAIIGEAMIRAAQERVQADEVKRIDAIYTPPTFPDISEITGVNANV